MKNMQLSIVSSPFNGTQLCKDLDTDIFFPEDYGDEVAVAKAKNICNSCWIQTSCLSFAMYEKEGIWGGTTPSERKKLRRKKVQSVRS